MCGNPQPGCSISLPTFATALDHEAGGDKNRSSYRQVPSTGRREPGERFTSTLAESGPPVFETLRRREAEAQRGEEACLESHSEDVWLHRI